MFVNETQARCALCPAANMTTMCIASACVMGWRWRSGADIEIMITTKNEPPAGDGWTLRGKVGAKWSWGRPWTDQRQGYCGFAGKPADPWNTDVVPCERE